MGKDKRKKWEENKGFAHVFEPDLLPIIKENKSFFLKGKWRSHFFHNEHPLVLELGCGKGEYTIGLARKYPEKNFIGIDVKGHRFHKGAKEAYDEGLKNVAFLRTRIEFITSFFDMNEVDEIWITFCDPQPQDHEGRRRMTSLWYLEKYLLICKQPSAIFLKHDNEEVWKKALRDWPSRGCVIEAETDDVYGDFLQKQSEAVREMLSIRTYYETIWLQQNKKIKYIAGRLNIK